MGVGKSTVAKCLAHILKCQKYDLDLVIEEGEKREIVDIITEDGEPQFRRLETSYLKKILAVADSQIISLGGGTWVVSENRQLIKSSQCTTIWLESTFFHCWQNINASKTRRPLAKDRKIAEQLFNERQKFYCLADWHFIVKPGLTSMDIAKQIVEEVF